MPAFDIIAIGAAVQDIFIKSKEWETRKDANAPDGIDALIPIGAKLSIDEPVIASGGGATNASVTFARFGLKAACFARVGDDVPGHAILEELNREGISTKGIEIVKKERTGLSIILLASTGQRGILSHRGVSASINPNVFPWHQRYSLISPFKTKWIYLTSLGGDKLALKKIFAHAKAHQIKIAWNPGKKELAHGWKTLMPYLKQTDILIMNREEAAELTNKAPRHLDQILDSFSGMPSLIIVTTDGGQGAYVRKSGKTLFSSNIKAKRVNTTGAGDAFGSAFVASYIQGHTLEIAMAAATLNATGVITNMGAKEGILPAFPSDKQLKKVKIRAYKGQNKR